MPKQNSAKKNLSRQEQRNLDIEIGFIEGVIRRDPQYIEALQILGDDYTRRGKFSEGLQVDERLAQLRPDDSLVQYNLACSYALTEQFEAAVDVQLPVPYLLERRNWSRQLAHPVSVVERFYRFTGGVEVFIL